MPSLLRAIASAAAVTSSRVLVPALSRPLLLLPPHLPVPSASPQASCRIPASTMAAAAQPQQQPGAPGEQQKKFTVAIEGCCHGELDNIYATLEYMQKTKGTKIDLLICCGDFQAVRNLDDMETMSIPLKYRQIMTFYKYYSGEKVAPIPTIFIGGNHEASNYLRELFYGGWAAPNIYFLGFAGCVQFGGHRIAGLSGTYVSQHYTWGHHERLPYDERAVKSVYHVRELEVHRLMQLHGDISLFLSHDWPNQITRYGDKARLFQKKPYFRDEAERGELGSPPNQQLLEALQPAYWFAAHLHCKFAAVVPHNQHQRQQQQGANPQQQQQQGQQFALPGMPAASAAAAGSEPKVTRFLALDKCLPNRDFLQLIELDVKGPLELTYDPQWLAVLRSTHGLYSANKHGGPRLPPNWGGRAGPSPADVAFVDSALQQRGGATIPLNFVQTAAAYDPQSGARRGNMPRQDLRNPQTLALLEMLGLSYNLDNVVADSTRSSNYTNRQWGGPIGGGGRTHYQPQTSLLSQQQPQRNPEEIDLDSDEDDGEQPAAAAAAAGGGSAAAAAAAAAAGQEEAADAEDEEPGGPPGGALADGAPDSDDEEGGQGVGGAAAAAAAARGEGSEQQQQQRQLDDPMFGEVNTAQFPYYSKE